MKKNHRLFFIAVICWVTFTSATSEERPPRQPATSASEQLLPDWIGLHLSLIRNTKGLSQVHIGRYFTYSGIALYESIVHGYPSYRTLGGQLQELNTLPIPATKKEFCWPASGNAALASMLRLFYSANPTHVKKIDSLENHYTSQFSKEGFSESNIQEASEYGKSVASAIAEWSKTDGFLKTNPPYDVPKGEGLWEPTPPAHGTPAGPYISKNRTCIKGSVDDSLPAPPISFSKDPGSAFYKMVKEVEEASQHLTEDQKAMGLFWDDFPDGRYYGALGHWASILRQVIVEKNIPLIKSAEAFTKMGLALSDATIACWKAKYTYNLLRPVTYVHRYMNQPTWHPLIVTPSHPEYPAAHASVSMAAAAALTDALGDKISFTDHTYDDLGFKARSFKNFEAAGTEAGLSRFYGGIHYKPSIAAGYILGKKVAQNVLNGVNFHK